MRWALAALAALALCLPVTAAPPQAGDDVAASQPADGAPFTCAIYDPSDGEAKSVPRAPVPPGARRVLVLIVNFVTAGLVFSIVSFLVSTTTGCVLCTSDFSCIRLLWSSSRLNCCCGSSTFCTRTGCTVHIHFELSDHTV